MTKIKLTGRFNDPDDFFDTEWNRDLFKEVGLDWDKFTSEQRSDLDADRVSRELYARR